VSSRPSHSALRASIHPVDVDELPADDEGYAALVRRQLALLGEDPDREGLVRTPDRVANAMQFLTAGYAMTVEASMPALCKQLKSCPGPRSPRPRP